MIAEIGHFALALAFLTAIAQSIAPLVGASRGWADYMRLGSSAATAQFTLLAISFAALTHVFVTSDFSVTLVYTHSHSAKPMLYKVSGVWGNHEGSMLFWALTLALFGAMIAWLGRNLPVELKARALAVQGMIGAAFLGFILFTSNPFLRWPEGLSADALVALPPDALMFPPSEGRDLNPLLQDVGLAFHPPFLYLGYVGLSTAYSFAVAAMLEGRVDAAWARWVRPWALAAWMFLTIGIALGSYWAYYELGWGGWWFWDPVENVSFIPWLAGAALLHSAIVVEKRGELKSWTVLLAIAAFSLSLIGTFVVRSGLLTSVHAFASDPTRGVFILLILAIAVGGSLWLYAEQAGKMGADGVFSPVSRESALLLNNVLLAAAAGAVFVGTMAPMVYEAFGEAITVGPPYFDLVFGALMLPLILALPVGAMLPWKRGDASKAMGKLWLAGVLSIAFGGAVWAAYRGAPLLAPIGAALAFWLILGSLVDMAERCRWNFGRLLRAPGADWGKTLGHLGLGATVLGATLVTALEVKDLRSATPGETFTLGGYEFRFTKMSGVRGPNYRSSVATVEVWRDGRLHTVMRPEQRFFPSQRDATAEAAIRSGLLDDVYISLGRQNDDGSWTLNTFVKPFVNWIWIGALMMSLGGVASLADRRHRVGAPARRKTPPAAPAAPTAPAE